MRVLFLTHRLPYAPNRGDRIRAFHMLHFLAVRAEVDLVSLVHDDEEEERAAVLRGVAASVHVARVQRFRNLANGGRALITGAPLTHRLLDSPDLSPCIKAIVARRRPDVVLAFCSSMARFALEPPLDRIPLVLDLVDVDSEKWRELAGLARWPLRWIFAREGRHLRKFEARAMTRARATLVVNEREAEAARRVASTGHVVVAANGIDVDHFVPPSGPVDNARVVFCGVMDYAPNEDGVLWFVRYVWPSVRSRRPDARFVIVGSNPTRRLLAACRSDSTIEITGTVADVRNYLWNSAVAVAPLWVARGVQNKVLETTAAGLPAIVTPAVRDGLPAALLPACSVAGTADEFACAVLDLLGLTAEGRREVACRARFNELAWDRVLAPLWQELSMAAAPSTVHQVVMA